MKTLIYILSIVLAPAQPTEPTLYNKDPGIYTAINPTKNKIKMIVDCGSDWQQVKLYLDAHETLVVQIKKPNGDDANCILDHFTWR